MPLFFGFVTANKYNLYYCLCQVKSPSAKLLAILRRPRRVCGNYPERIALPIPIKEGAYRREFPHILGPSFKEYEGLPFLGLQIGVNIISYAIKQKFKTQYPSLLLCLFYNNAFFPLFHLSNLLFLEP